MNNQNDRNNISEKASAPNVSTVAGPLENTPAFIVMVSNPDPKHDDGREDNQPGNLPAEVPVTEPLTPVPAEDEVNPPLKATLGGDDVVIPLEQ